MGSAYVVGGGTSSISITVPKLFTNSSPNLPPLTFLPPPLSSPSPPSSIKLQHFLVSDSKRLSSFHVKASPEDTSDSSKVGEVFSDLKEKWDALENKSSIILYGGGALIAVWLSSTIIDAINRVPVLPKIMELFGVGYTGWFVSRYLLFKSGREELASDIEAVKKKIAGTEE